MRKACVIGWPVGHSRSPLIHHYWLKEYGIDGAYEKRAVPPEEIESFLRSFGAQGLVGANVTLPHKEAALRFADHADEAALAIGAANTLWLDDGALWASNTDACGFMQHLGDTVPDWQASESPAMVLGAGGAARAILFGLLEAGVPQIFLANRTREKAERLADAMTERFGDKITVVDWKTAEASLGVCGLLVNATSLGMAGQPPLPIGLLNLPEQAVVADIVYSPLVTPLLASAIARGNPTVDGLGMLLHQAVPGFERWFGVRPEVTPALRALVEADLKLKGE